MFGLANSRIENGNGNGNDFDWLYILYYTIYMVILYIVRTVNFVGYRFDIGIEP